MNRALTPRDTYPPPNQTPVTRWTLTTPAGRSVTFHAAEEAMSMAPEGVTWTRKGHAWIGQHQGVGTYRLERAQ